MRDEEHAEESRIRQFLEPGLEIAGNVTGAGIGLLLGGPAGAVIGAAVPTVVSRVLQEFMDP